MKSNSLKKQLLQIVGAVFFLSAGMLLYVDYLNARAEIYQSMLQQARTIRELLMATRTVYSKQFVASGVALTPATVGFLPAHAMGRISKQFSKNVTWGVSFNNVSDRARNIEQQADAHEMAAIRYFQQDPDVTDRMVLQEDHSGNSFFHYSSPLWITAICLKCHGKREDAPRAIRENYDKAYGYKLGDIRGIISVKLQSKILDNAAKQHLITSALAVLLGFVFTYLVVIQILKKRVLSRISVLSDATQRMVDGDYTQHLTTTSGDEIGKVINGFNFMSDAVESREKLLKESFERTKAIIDGSAEGIILADVSGNIIEINWAACQIFDFSQQPIGQKLGTLIEALHSDRLANQTTNGVPFNRRIELDGVVLSGELVPLEVNVSKTIYKNEPLYIVMMQDITLRKKAEEEVAETKRKYFHQEKVAAVGQLASGILHEIGNPISAMSGSVSYLLSLTDGQSRNDDSGSFVNECAESLDVINGQIERLVGITHEIANFVSPQRFDSEIYDLNSIIEGNCGLLRYDQRLKYIDIQYQLSRDINAAKGIPDHLVQVFLNLMINSGHACQEAKRDLAKIVVTTGEEERGLYLTIADNGTGINEEIADKVFEPFFTTKEAGVGTGLGLSLCKSLMEEEGGMIEVVTIDGMGTEMWVWLQKA